MLRMLPNMLLDPDCGREPCLRYPLFDCASGFCGHDAFLLELVVGVVPPQPPCRILFLVGEGADEDGPISVRVLQESCRDLQMI